MLFKYGYQINPDVSMLSSVTVQTLHSSDEGKDSTSQCYTVPKSLKSFTIAEMAGSEVTYGTQYSRTDQVTF